MPRCCRFAAAVLLAVSASRAAEIPARSDDALLKAAAALYDGIKTETLPNGLRVFLKPIAGSPTVTSMVVYKVGSCDEDLAHTGLAHYLEHLMFKGTDKLKPGDIDRLTLRNGGANNAYTSEDITAYHFDFAADRWETALEIEADRMMNLRIDAKHEFQEEKGAVISELERDEDRPWDIEFKVILPHLFGTGPYGHSVIGEREHVKDATAEVIKAYYDRWYAPNNAVLVVVGGFDPDRALTRIRELFGPIPKKELPARRLATAVKRDAPVVKQFDSKFDVPRLVMGYNTVASDHADFPAIEVLQMVLSSGKLGRLYTKLVEGEEVANDVGAHHSSGRFPGWFGVYAESLKGKDRRKIEELLLGEIERLRKEPPTETEMARVRRGLLSHTIFELESVHSFADTSANGTTLHDLEWLRSYLGRMYAVTAADVQRVAAKYLDPQQRVVVWSVPKPTPAGAGAGDAKAAPKRSDIKPVHNRRNFADAAPASGAFTLKAARRVVLDNGLVLLLMENRRLPIVVAAAQVRRVRLHEPADKAGVAMLMGSLLDEGTALHTGPEISKLIEDAGGSLSFDSGGGSVKVLTPDASLGLGLLFECLSRAGFPKDAFERQRERQLTDIDDAETQPDTRAQRVFRSLVYGPHPAGRSAMGTRKTVEALAPADCAALHAKVFVPNNTIVSIVGDFDADAMVAQVRKLTADWKKRDLAVPEFPAPPAIDKFAETVITMPDAAQLAFYLGHLGVRRSDPDYYKLLVMDYVLGTGPGFTDRLSSRLRDREGLAYTVSANISSSADELPGVFTCYIGTDPANFARVRAGFLEELARIRETEAKPEEVEDAKKYLLGSLPFRFTTGEAIAGQLVAVERLGLGFDYLDDYRKAVAAVTPADVLDVAKRRLNPLKMVLVAAGAIDKDGKALKPTAGN